METASLGTEEDVEAETQKRRRQPKQLRSGGEIGELGLTVLEKRDASKILFNRVIIVCVWILCCIEQNVD